MLGIPQENQVQILHPWPLPLQIRVHLPARAACPPAAAAQAAAAEDARCKWGGTPRGWAGHQEALAHPPSSLLQVFIPSSSESSDEEDEEFCTLEWALTLAMLETEFHCSSSGHEMLLLDFSDSD